MLQEAVNREAVLAKVLGNSIEYFPQRNFARIGENEWQPVVLVDDQENPQVLVLHAGANCMIVGALEHYQAAFADLLAGRVEQTEGWPDPALKHDWEEAKRRYLFINSSPYSAWRAAKGAGFEPHPEDIERHVAYLWYWQGEPRFSKLVRHPCRVIESGQELFELMRQAVGYDPDGWYIKQCLEKGPSFVCEVDGQPVSWSCTHLNRTMGMIYTPEELRRHGYARSLSAFQLDYMLRADGEVCCHIIDSNVPSMLMVASLGARRLPEPVVWRGVYWPGEAPPPEERTTKLTAGENEQAESESAAEDSRDA